MALIDVDKFVCSLLSKIEKQKDHIKGIGWLEADGKYRFITNLLADQGIIYKDGSLIKIGSKKCEGKLKEMLDEKVLANSCESSKDEQKSLKIEEGKLYVCDFLPPTYVGYFSKSVIYKSKTDGYLRDNRNIDCDVSHYTNYFHLATEEEIKEEFGNTEFSQRIESAKAKEEGYSKSEEYDEIALRDGDDNGITIQVMADGRNVSDFRISKGQAHILKAELEAYICKF